MNGVASDNPNYLSIADFIGLIANFPLTSAVKIRVAQTVT